MTIFSNFRDQLHLVQCFSTNTFWMQMASTCVYPSSHTLTKTPSRKSHILLFLLSAVLKLLKSLLLFCFQDHSLWRPAFMELGPPSWRTLILFSCRLLCKKHKFQQPKMYNVPKVGLTIHLRNPILRLIIIRIT